MISFRFVMVASAVASFSAVGLAAKTTYAPITYRETSGIRPYVHVKLNGQPLLLMVHANAGFNAMITHANAKKADVRDLHPKDQFGITSVGVKSTLGRDTATADTFTVGGSTIRRMPIQIFEIPQAPPVDGMAGIGWLKEAKVMVDYKRDRLAIPATNADAAKERRRLTTEGYIAIPMTWDATADRYFVNPKVNGVIGRFNVSTVAQVVLDERFARARKIPLSAPIDTFGGPTGTTGDVRETADHYVLELAGEALIAPKARAYDIYAYDAETRPANTAEEVVGYLGCDFMRANGAVIDFGSGTLFVKRHKPN